MSDCDLCDFCTPTALRGDRPDGHEHTRRVLELEGVIDNDFVGDSIIWCGGADLDCVFKALGGQRVRVRIEYLP